MAERDGYGPPDLVIKAPEYTMPAVSMDQWWRPVSDIPVTEPRWIRMVEIRPTNIQSRKILHHSIAYHILNQDNVAAVNQGVQVARGVSFSGSAAPSARPPPRRKRPCR